MNFQITKTHCESIHVRLALKLVNANISSRLLFNNLQKIAQLLSTMLFAQNYSCFGTCEHWRNLFNQFDF